MTRHRELPGGVLYLALAGLTVLVLDRDRTDWIATLFLTAPAAATGLLFLISTRRRAPEATENRGEGRK